MNFEMRVDNLDKDVRELRTDVSQLRGEVNDLRGEVDDLRTDVHGLRIDVTEIKTTIPFLATKAEVANSRNVIIYWLIGLFVTAGVFNHFPIFPNYAAHSVQTALLQDMSYHAGSIYGDFSAAIV